jgi:hypothetical protein
MEIVIDDPEAVGSRRIQFVPDCALYWWFADSILHS